VALTYVGRYALFTSVGIAGQEVHHDEEVPKRMDPGSCAAAPQGPRQGMETYRTGQPLEVPPPAELDRNENDATDAATARKFTQQTDTILGLILDP
jgi:hypothetical protein